MKKAAGPTTQSTHVDSEFTLGTLGLDLLDTTWRIAIPVIAFAALGIFADLQLGTKPWLTLLSVIIGFVPAGFLIKKQIQAVEKEEKKK